MGTKQSATSSSPKPSKTVRVAAPSTPPLSKGRNSLLAGLSTPDGPHDTIPFSPGLKRSSTGAVRSPDPRLNEAFSPYSTSNMLKTPGNPEYDSDERETPRRPKLLKTPQYFSPDKRLFAGDSSPNKKELNEISSQLKHRLSLAFGSLQQKEKSGSGVSPAKLDFSDGPYFSSKESPTRVAGAPSRGERTRSAAVNRTNINLRTLQASPRMDPGARHASYDLATRFPPHEQHYQHHFSMLSQDEESSAHNALLLALSRLKERRQSQNNGQIRPSVGLGLGLGLIDLYPALSHKQHMQGMSPLLPNADGASEQEAVYSLMSLSSPQTNKHDFNIFPFPGAMPAHSHVDNSKELWRSLSVAMPVLPPVTGPMRKIDDDETDVEDETTSEDEDTS